MAERDCGSCGDTTPIRRLGKIKGKQLCKKCRVQVRKNHREETKNLSSEEERNKIIELSKKQKAEYQKAHYKKIRKEKQSEEIPVIKGSKQSNKKLKSNSYLTFEDRKQLLRILMKKGLDFDGAKERLSEVLKEQERIREVMKEENKSKKQIKIREQELLEELWNC